MPLQLLQETQYLIIFIKDMLGFNQTQIAEQTKESAKKVFDGQITKIKQAKSFSSLNMPIKRLEKIHDTLDTLFIKGKGLTKVYQFWRKNQVSLGTCKMQGVYEGYFIRMTNRSLSKMVLQLKEDGQILYKIDGNDLTGEYKHLAQRNRLWAKADSTLDERLPIYQLFINSELKGVDNQYMEGIYAGFDQNDLVPISGRIRFYKVAGAEDADQAYQNHSPENFRFADIKEVKPELLSFFIGNEPDSYYFNECPQFYCKENLMKDISLRKNELDSHYNGTYEAYFIGTQRNHIRKLVFQIRDDGSVEYSRTTQSGVETLSGNYHLHDGNIFIDCDKMGNGEYRIRYILKYEENQGEVQLKGVMSGNAKVHNHPFAARIIFYKTHTSYKEIAPGAYDIDSDSYLQLFKEKPDLMSFFLGYNDKFSHIRFFIQSGLLRETSRTLHYETYKDIAGAYLNYSLDIDHKAISANPLYISKDGRVEMKGMEGRIFYGEVIQAGLHLIIQFYEKSEEGENQKTPWNFFLMFYLGSQKRAGIECLNGIGANIESNENSLACGREILWKVEEDWGKLAVDSIPIPIPPHQIDRSNYDALNTQRNGLATMLTGPEHNIIKVPRKFDRSILQREIRYGELFFYAATFIVKNDTEKAKSWLKHAAKNGFGITVEDQHLLKEYVQTDLQTIRDWVIQYFLIQF